MINSTDEVITDNNTTDKLVHFLSPIKHTIENEKEKKRKKITYHAHWKSNISLKKQKEMIAQLFEQLPNNKSSMALSENFCLSEEHSSVEESLGLLQKQIMQKLTGYKCQDVHNSIFRETEFIDFEKTIQLLYQSELSCYYCKHPVTLLYDYVREPSQWTLERLNNKKGHNHDNVVIACLKCNLRRRTMFHERYLFTKEMNQQKIIKLDIDKTTL